MDRLPKFEIIFVFDFLILPLKISFYSLFRLPLLAKQDAAQFMNYSIKLIRYFNIYSAGATSLRLTSKFSHLCVDFIIKPGNKKAPTVSGLTINSEDK